jgi:hypothetical protein
MSKILEIKEVDNICLSNGDWDQNYEGYIVKTEDKEYKVLISNSQSCCESFGYLQSEDDLAEFIGAELFSVQTTDVGLVKGELEYGYEDGDIMFVDFNTSKGTFQLAVYNAHNGYYGHGIIITTDEKEIIGGL